jgi:hypothetical protein
MAALLATMTERDEPPGRTSFDAAVDFVADQPGGPERTLALHHRLADGYCAGCLSRPTPWPCTAAAIAQRAGRTNRG